jgi:pyruvate-formate lyase-activating enzyme
MPLADTEPLSGYLDVVTRRRDLSLSGKTRLAPDGLWIAITENCNFRCIGCYREGLFKKTYVSVDEVRRMLQDDRGHSYDYISLTTGEAFLHPEFCDIIEACREAQPQAEIDVISNCSIPLKGRFRKAVSMIDKLGLSIDGARAETFESIRIGGNFAKFVENAREICAIRKETGKPSQLGFSFTAITRNIAELPDVVRLAAELGVPLVYAQPMEMDHPEIIARTGRFHLRHMPIEEVYRISDAAVAVGKALGVQVDLAGYLIRPDPAQGHEAETLAEPSSADIEREVRQCQYPYLKPFQYVRSGQKFRVLPCCYMVETMADVMADRYGMDYDSPPPVVDQYNSEEYWRFRTDLAAGKCADICGNCLQARTYPAKVTS